MAPNQNEQKREVSKPRHILENRPKHQINVSSSRYANFYVFLGKMRLKDSEKIELHALGNAVATSVMAAENLVRNNYATIVGI